MEKKEILTTLKRIFPNGIIYPETNLSIDNPDFIFTAQGRLFGCYIPTCREKLNPSSFLRRLYMSRLTYIKNLETIMISEETPEPFLLSVQHSFNYLFDSMPPDINAELFNNRHRMMTKRIKWDSQFHKDHISQYWRITKFLETYIQSQHRYSELDFPQQSQPVPVWGSRNNKSITLSDSYEIENNLLTNKAFTTVPLRQSLDKMLNYQLFSSFDYDTGYLAYRQRPSIHFLNTGNIDRLILNGDKISAIGHALAFMGICPIAIQSDQEYQAIIEEINNE